MRRSENPLLARDSRGRQTGKATHDGRQTGKETHDADASPAVRQILEGLAHCGNRWLPEIQGAAAFMRLFRGQCARGGRHWAPRPERPMCSPDFARFKGRVRLRCGQKHAKPRARKLEAQSPMDFSVESHEGPDADGGRIRLRNACVQKMLKAGAKMF